MVDFSEFSVQKEEGQNKEPQVVEVQKDDPQLLDLLRNHAIEVISRCKPSKKTYYEIIMEDFSIRELLDYSVTDILRTKTDDLKNRLGQGITFQQYLEGLF